MKRLFPRTSSGHADLADAVTTAIYESSKKRIIKPQPTQKIRYVGPLGGIWVEGGEEEPFNWPHLVEVDDEG